MRKFWQIATDETNGEEYFGKSDHRSSVVSLYSQKLARKFSANCALFANPSPIFPIVQLILFCVDNGGHIVAKYNISYSVP